MNAKFLILSSCGAVWAMSLLASCNGFAQTSLQIRNNSMVLRSNGQTMVLTSPGSTVYSSSSSTSSQIVQTNGRNVQRSSVTLNASALRQPCWLTISIPSGQLTGQVKIGNKVIQSLKGARTSVNLAPYLWRGTKTIEISGNYQPARGAVRIEFSGAGSRVSQQSSGSGTFNHSLIVTVR